MKNYRDHKNSFNITYYQSTVARELAPYEKVMGCRNHEDVRWAMVRSGKGIGIGITVKRLDSLQVAALPYSDEGLETAESMADLPNSQGTVLGINHNTLVERSNS